MDIDFKLVYQRVALRMTYESIAEMVTEQFHEKMSWSYTIQALENLSAFYAETETCRQQKCWAHLIRDLNDDLWKCPFDSEYETFMSAVRNLIIPIMEAVQKYGLKKRHLHRFMQHVSTFYIRTITGKQYTSELVIKYQKRFVRYRESLFTFLEYDRIPWHNNTAERALRHIAKQ